MELKYGLPFPASYEAHKNYDYLMKEMIEDSKWEPQICLVCGTRIGLWEPTVYTSEGICHYSCIHKEGED